MIERVKLILETEANAIKNIPLDNNIEKAIKEIINCKGKVFTTGLGKAGYIARKAASTFSTTGTPSAFLHPADSSHGDIGVISKGDILLAYSNSGRTREIIETVSLAKALKVSSVITITSKPDSPLSKQSDITLNIGDSKEACPLGFTPSSSTATMAAISDALALVSMQERGFSNKDFALRHHGGYLGVKSKERLK